MEQIKNNYLKVKEDISSIAFQNGRNPEDIRLVAVSKGRSLLQINALYELGPREFGENRVQEALPKIEEGPKDIKWHFIGTLQLNKVRKIIGKFALIHSVDTPELASKISDCSLEEGIITPILIQVNTSGEASKHGLRASQWKEHLEKLCNLQGIRIEGLMTMAPLTDDNAIIRSCFASLRLFRDEMAGKIHPQITLRQLSMGMSHDYPIAIQEGATLLRIGTAIFEG